MFLLSRSRRLRSSALKVCPPAPFPHENTPPLPLPLPLPLRALALAFWAGLASVVGLVPATAQTYVRPYGPNAPWNRPVRDAAGNQLIPVHSQSNTYRHRHYVYSPAKNGSKPGNFNLNPGYTGYTYPVYHAADATGNYVVQTPVNYANMDGFTMPWNSAWSAGGGSDAQVIVLDPATGREWNLWQVTFSSNTINASNANVIQTTETNIPQGTNPYPTAANYATKENGFIPSRGCGIQYLAMLVRPEEIQQGKIEHALSLPVANPSGQEFYPPATKLERSFSDTGVEVPEGMRFALNVTDAEIETWLNGLPSDLPNRAATVNSCRIIARAMREYGWFITDTSGGAHFQLEDYHSAHTEWVSLGLGYNTSDHLYYTGGKTYPSDLLDGLITESRIYTLVKSTEYPPTGGGGTTTNLNPTTDAYVDGSFPTTNYGGATTLKVKDGADTGFDRISYLKFGLGGISGTITSAKLRVYCGALSNGSGAVAKAFAVSTDTWTETGVTWNNKPALGAQQGAQLTYNATGWYEYDVTSYITAEKAGDGTASLAVADNTLVNKMIDLNSREGTNKPVLVVVTAIAPSASLNPTADSYVDGGATGSNFGGAVTMKIKDGAGTSFDRITYLKFSLTGVTGPINSAKLRVYCNALSNGTGAVAKAFAVSTDTWTETGVTWNNKPALGAQQGSQVTFNATGWHEFTVTSFVSGEFAGDKVVTLALSDNIGVDKMVDLDSREATNKPVLLINQ